MSIQLFNSTNYTNDALNYFFYFRSMNNTDCFDFSAVRSARIFRAAPSFLRRRATVFRVSVILHSANGSFILAVILLKLFNRRRSLFTRNSTSACHFRMLQSINRLAVLPSTRNHLTINFKHIHKSYEFFF